MNEIVSASGTKLEKIKTKARSLAVRSVISTEKTICELMRTKWGRRALAIPMALCGLSIRAYADGDSSGQANEILGSIMKILGPGVITLGTLVAVVGGIQLGKGFTRDDADAKAQGMMTMIGGVIIGAVGAIIPDNLSIG